MIENHNPPKAPFSNKDVINTLSWTEKLVAENGFNCNECVRVMGGDVHGMISCDQDAEECTESFDGLSLSLIREMLEEAA